MASGASYTTDVESRWVVIGICLNKVVTPTLRKVVDAELKSWHQDLCKPPVEIDKQVFGSQIRTLPPSTFSLQYKNINGNDVHRSPRAYDYAVKDALSLAKLFVQPFMAKFTGFDDTMDLSALLTIMCEADPFITSGASVYAKNVRSKVRNEWARCNFSNWTDVMFNDAIQDLECLLRNIKLSPDLEKQACDDLLKWKNKVSDVFVEGRYSKLLDELRRSVETAMLEIDKKENDRRLKRPAVELNHLAKKLRQHSLDSPGSWEWRRTSQKHRDKFEKLHEFGKKSPETITEINDVRVCFKKECLIKRGSDGTCVFVGLSKDGGERAVKRLVRDDDICSSLAEQEKEILNERNAIKSNHVVQYRFLDKSNEDWLYLIMDLCEETLEDFVQRSSRDELLKIGQHIIQQILRGLADIHHDPRSILHRDLKPSNILRDVDGNWLLGDFGISRILTPGKSTCRSKQKGTDHWRAVESCLNYASGSVEVEVRYKKESDVQVAGMLAFYVLTKGKHPFGEEPDQLRNVLDGKPVYLNMVKDPAANDLISWMLSHEPKDRPLAEEALKHPYLASPEQQFKMLCEVANQREIKKRGVDSDVVQKLNTISGDWQNQIDPKVLNYLRIDFDTGRPHNYGPSWRECLRLIRNMNQHWYDISRQRPQPDEEFYLVDNPQKYFLNVFPNLPTDVHRIVRSSDWKERPNIKEYFQ